MGSLVLDHEPARLLDRVRQHRPLVQCLTSSVVAGFTANVLLALGASPAMADVPGEAGAFARVADGVLVNLGTPAPHQQQAMLEVVAQRRELGLGWVLDPVAVGGLPVRDALAARLLEGAPTVIRGNPSEVLALAGHGQGGRGTDTTAAPHDALDAARGLASRTGGAVAISGPADEIVGSGLHIRNDVDAPALTRVTGGGCALGAVIAAFLAVSATAPPAVAAAAATACWTVAARAAAQDDPGPGTFAVRLLDELAALAPASLNAAGPLRLVTGQDAPTVGARP